MPQQTLGELFTSVINEIKPVVMTGSDSMDDGTAGYVPAPTAADYSCYLKGDGTWSFVRQFPAAPTSDGDYILKATVSNHTIQYSWIALSDLNT